MKRGKAHKALKGKKRGKLLRTEKQVRGRALKQARKLAAELLRIHTEAEAAKMAIGDEWLWIVDLKRAYYAMEHVIDILEGSDEADTDGPAGNHQVHNVETKT